MSHGIKITCGHCGAQTGFDQAVEGLPMDHFRCSNCAKVWKRCHGKPHYGYSGHILPGSVTIKQVKACVKQRQGVGALPSLEVSHA